MNLKKNNRCTYIAVLLAIALFSGAITTQANTLDNTQWVDPFIGTAGDHGQLHPAATLPFGMVQMGPETPGRPHSGYDFYSGVLEGFAHTRTAGVGCRGSGGSVLVRADYGMPLVDQETGALTPVVINKTQESAAVGYYQVNYGKPEIQAQMTVSASSGWQRYVFPTAGDVVITVDTAHAHHESYGGSYKVDKKGQVKGMTSGPTVCKEGRFQFYFSLKPSIRPDRTSALDDQRVQLFYKVKAGDTLTIHTGISAVSEKLAEKSRSVDAKVGGFDEARQAAIKQWQTTLNKFVVDADEEAKKLFYTNLYHVYQSPSLMTGSVNKYRGSDGKVYKPKGREQYFGWSIWDNFRTQLPLLTILEAETMEDITASLAALYSENKKNWATETEPLPTVRTEHSGIVLLDAWTKGIQSFDLQKLLPLLAQDADNMPRNSPDQILEAAYDDWAVAKFAKLAGNGEWERKYTERAKDYRSIWREKFKVITDKSDIMHGDGLYEGTLWQYRWFVPHDTSWIIAELGGNDEFAKQLQYFFDNELFNIGNQPDIQAPFMFNFVNHPWRTQDILHKIIQTKTNNWYGTHKKKKKPFFRKVFQATPKAFIKEMDNDAGTMSGWYLFTVLGFYPAIPGEPVYTLHTPQLKSASLSLAKNKVFKIITDKDPKTNPYIDSVTLNGKTLNRSWITHQEIVQGGEIVFNLVDKPNKNWGLKSPYVTKL